MLRGIYILCDCRIVLSLPTRRNYHVNNKYKNELINYPTSCRERRTADDGNTAVAAIGVVRNERGCSLSREDQGGRYQVP